MHCITHSETQHRGSNLKSMWVIRDRDLLTNYRACARRAGICRNFLQKEKCGQVPFSLSSFSLTARCWWKPVVTLSIYLANTTCPTPWSPVEPPTQRCPSQVAPIPPHLVGSLSQNQCLSKPNVDKGGRAAASTSTPATLVA